MINLIYICPFSWSSIEKVVFAIEKTQPHIFGRFSAEFYDYFIKIILLIINKKKDNNKFIDFGLFSIIMLIVFALQKLKEYFKD